MISKAARLKQLRRLRELRLKKAAKSWRADGKLYVRKGLCPFCGSDYVEGMVDRPLIQCGNCQAQWAEITKLVGIEVARQPEALENLEEAPAKGSPMDKG